ncbi:MAG: isochorismatase family protein [Phycisphaerae bacterium]|nr:isochorismatase family protein [Phycisphaerae bacterium]
MLEIQDCCLIVVDVQGKLVQLMVDKEVLFKNIRILIQAAKVLEIPILWCEQVPAALGPAVPEIAELLTGLCVEGVPPSNRGQDARDARVLKPVEPINKASFSCCGQEQFNAQLNTLGKEQVLLCGIETHVCIYQTAMDLMEGGLDVTVLADAVSSRTDQNRRIALTRLAAEGAHISSTEMALFELLRTAKHPQFKDIAKLVK